MTLDEEHADEIAARLSRIAIEAGRLLRSLEGAALDTHVKSDGTPTSSADLAAEELIIRRLHKTWAGVPVVAEETANVVSPSELFFLVDPLDGTGDFLHGTGEYSVNIALVRGGRPLAAAVAAPALARVWMAGREAKAAELPTQGGACPDEMAWRTIRVRKAPSAGLVALVSRRHGDGATEACLAALSIGTRRTASSALKFCLIAAGEADVYVRCGPTMEWDTAAGDHVLCCAGGRVIGPGGEPLTYGHERRGYRNGPFAALGDMALASRLSLPEAAAI
jgi:3'(2'), 5'-bisphosphate nucleotidase